MLQFNRSTGNLLNIWRSVGWNLSCYIRPGIVVTFREARTLHFWLIFGKCVANFSGNWWHMARVGAPYFWCCHIVEIKDDHNAICIVLWCTMAEWWWGIIGKVGGAPCASMHWSDLHCTLPCNALMWTSLQYINFLLQFWTIRSNKSVNCTMHM